MDGYAGEKMARAIREEVHDDDVGPAMQAVHALHKHAEHLHLQMDRLERKLKPVLRSVGDEAVADAGRDLRAPSAEVTERLEQVGQTLDRVAVRIGDLITRCEL